MRVVEIHTSGDVWLNKDQVIKEIYAISTRENVVFDTKFEGISLRALGVLTVVDEWVTTTGRNHTTVQFNTPNHYEKIHYKFSNIITLGAHFLTPKLINYHKDFTPIDTHKKLFGLFVGRYTEMRNMLALFIVNNYSNYCVMSVMSAGKQGATSWWSPEVEAIGSIDNHKIVDQYNSTYNTNQSLLQFYNDFQIEIIAETVTLGESFFPTEKTVRPIMGSKPFLTYAPINYLANLQNLGFETFSELWSEDYDQYEGIERWARMKLVITSIIEQGYDCNLAQDIVQYNYNHLQKLIKNG